MKILRYLLIGLCALFVLGAALNLTGDVVAISRGVGLSSYLIGRIVGSLTIGILLLLLINYLWRKNRSASESATADTKLMQ